MSKPPYETLELNGHEVKITNPAKVFFPQIGITKWDLVTYYLSVSEGVLRGCQDRPTSLKRFPNGAEGDFFFQKRVPDPRPEWIKSVLVKFPSGRTADFLTIVDEAHLAWAINLGCIDINPWPVRRGDVDHPDELRVDLDPTPGVAFSSVREVAITAKEVLEEHGLVGFPKTSGSRGIHINVRIRPEWGFTDVRKAALALGREVQRREPAIATTAWWKEERHGVFIDYNQNARDRTVASAYSVRPTPDARVSCPLGWDEIQTAELADFTISTIPTRFQEIGDPSSSIDESVGGLEGLLDLSEKQGMEDAPWPPHFDKKENEPPRVAPSRAKTTSKKPKA